MASKFNYERAHREWAVPEYIKLPIEIDGLRRSVAALAPFLRQVGAGIGFTHEGISDVEFAALEARFDSVPGELLAHAMKVIYYCGHWNTEGSTLPYQEEHGAYWKFEHLAKASLIRRSIKWEEHPDMSRFMDHEEGTDYDNDELTKMFAPLVASEFEMVGVRNVNWRVHGKPAHPFVIGPKHFPKDGGIYIDVHQAGCAQCGASYEDHVSDRVVMLRPKTWPSDNKLTNAQRATLVSLEAMMKKHKIDGVAFAK